MSLRSNRHESKHLPSHSLIAGNPHCWPICGLLLALAAAAPVQAQLKAKVTVDTSKPKSPLYTTSIGGVEDRWDNKGYDADTVKLLQDAGVSLLRLPGNGGIDALYHFSTGVITNPYDNDRAPAFAAGKKFPATVSVIDQLGTALINVNYGSNLDGSGGGEPAEAAAWVAYANGSDSNTQAIGKDSKGNDWKTVGYWAALRGASPLPTDDGLNSLRIGHSEPLGILLWAIGDSPASNGFYGQEPSAGSDADNVGAYGQPGPMEPDLHAGRVGNSKQWGKHENNAKASPQAYGAAVVDFAKAMKAVDPKILIGAALTMPPLSTDAHPYGKKWNEGVLKAACASMDFATMGFFEGVDLPNVNDVLDEDELLLHGRYNGDANNHYQHQNSLSRDFSMLAGDMGDKYKKFCPTNHYPQLAITGFGVPVWKPAKNPAAYGLFAADSLATLLQDGAYTVVWSPIHAPTKATSPSFLDENNKPGPAFYGIKMLHEAGTQGSTFVTTSSDNESFGTYAFKRQDGGFGLLLVNKNIDRSVSATVSVPGYNFAAKGTRYDWGKSTIDAGKGITEAPIDGLGATFTVEVPRYGITVIVAPKP